MPRIQSAPCRVCAGQSNYAFSNGVIGHQVSYFDCPSCGYLQTQEPFWLDQAYSRAINEVDTGIMFRNRLNTGRVVMTLLALRRLGGRVVDHAGGYGILVRLLRDAGVDALWRDKYCDNLLARGFEAREDGCELMTAFEVFEHFVDPLAELKAMLAEAPAVLISTDLIQTERTPPADWWYLGPEHGQHIGFFRSTTLQRMASLAQCHWASDGQSLHLFSRDPIPASWLFFIRMQRWWPLVARFKLRSRVMDDFELLRSHARATQEIRRP